MTDGTSVEQTIIEQKGRRLDLPERVDPSHTALIVIDIQNDFCHANGIFGKLGYNLSATTSAIDNLRELISEARRQRILTIFVRGNEDGRYLSVPMAETYNRRAFRTGLVRKGTWGADWYRDIRPLDAPNEIDFVKHRFGAFESTPLDLYLRSNAIKTLIAGGVVTSGCVESTIRNAFSQGYYVVVPPDCVADASEDRHKASIQKIEQAFGDVVPSADIIEVWRRSGSMERRWEKQSKSGRVFSDLRSQLSPTHTALILVDLQQDFCSPDGALARNGASVSRIQAALPAIEELLTAARHHGIMVLHLGTINSDLYSSDVGLHKARDEFAACCRANAPGAAFLPQFAPRPDEDIVIKYRSGGFGDTHLELLLRSASMRTAVVVGFGVSRSIESTVREASDRDYYVFVPEDCVASADRDCEFDAASLQVMARHFAQIVPSPEIVDVWRGLSTHR